MKFANATALATVGAKNLTRIDGERFYDPFGRQLTLHGVNAVYKIHPYIPSTGDEFDSENSLNLEDIHNLRNWGMNFVRLGVMWEAVETSPGVYNSTYLEEVSKLVDTMGQNGIYTMIDAHQDVMARITCGEGIPDFYAKQAAAGAKCYGDWSSPEFSDAVTLYGPCKTMDSYGY